MQIKGTIISLAILMNALFLSFDCEPGNKSNNNSSGTDPNKSNIPGNNEKSEINNPTDSADHEKFYEGWTKILKKYVYPGKREGIRSNLIRYKKVKTDSDFKELILWLENAKPPKKKNERLAFWINSYNIYIFRLMSENLKSKSIMNISGGKAFDISHYKIAGKKRSLNHIEKKIVAKLNKYMYHFGLVCGAASCPDIGKRAYLPKNVYNLLHGAAKRFLKNKTKGLKLDHKNKIVHLSTLGDWYKNDFKFAGSFREFAAKFFNSKKKDAILNYKIKWIPYVWSRN